MYNDIKTPEIRNISKETVVIPNEEATRFMYPNPKSNNMYTRLSKNTTKSYYRSVIEQAIVETQKLMLMSPEVTMYNSIYNQLVDLKTKVVLNNIIIPKFDLYRMYSLGSIAAKNFDLENDEYAQRLSDSYSGAFDYHRMPEI